MGQLDDQGRACGIGFAGLRSSGKNSVTYQGSFFNDTFEGIGVLNNEHAFEGEFRGGKKHGNFTVHCYSLDRRIINAQYNDDQFVEGSESEDIRKNDIKRYYKLDYEHGSHKKHRDFVDKQIKKKHSKPRVPRARINIDDFKKFGYVSDTSD